ncbi:hypothetical protein BHM03_00033182 [Ensete ventricosum]|nr:hypothetical protein BHM03_00033182 [Ensete ventricosum]
MDHPVGDPNRRRYFQPAATLVPFSLSTPCRLASSSAGSITVATLTLSSRPFTNRASSDTPILLLPPPSTSSSSSPVAATFRCPAMPPPPQQLPLPSYYHHHTNALPSSSPPLLLSSLPLLLALAAAQLRRQHLHRPLPTVVAPLLPSPCNHALPSLLHFAMVPQPLVLPQPLFIARRLPSLPPVTDFPTVITPQQLLQPPYRYQLLPPWPLLPLLPLPFPSFVHHNLTLLFITRRSSITARTMLSASPFDAIVVSISSLLPHTSSTPLLLLCCQCLVLASYRCSASQSPRLPYDSPYRTPLPPSSSPPCDRSRDHHRPFFLSSPPLAPSCCLPHLPPLPLSSSPPHYRCFPATQPKAATNRNTRCHHPLLLCAAMQAVATVSPSSSPPHCLLLLLAIVAHSFFFPTGAQQHHLCFLLEQRTHASALTVAAHSFFPISAQQHHLCFLLSQHTHTSVVAVTTPIYHLQPHPNCHHSPILYRAQSSLA